MVLCQISNSLINPRTDDSLAGQYYESIYDSYADFGYVRPKHFWELPLWIGELSFVDEFAKLRVITDADVKLEYYEFHCFSVLEVNKSLIKHIIQNNPDIYFNLGGYVDPEYFSDCPNAIWYNSIKELCDDMQIDYKYGVDWRLFEGEHTIPRMTMSYGCNHNCKFCTVPHGVKPVPEDDIINQVKALRDLYFKLVYLNDKTFGQCANHTMLQQLYHEIKFSNADFNGFIVQTSVATVLRADLKQWKRSGVVVVELGIESFNDEVLRRYNKPQTEKMIGATVRLLKDAGFKVIFNIILGLPGETKKTYEKTLAFIGGLKPFALNIYTLAVYNDSQIGIEGLSEADSDELATDRTFWTYEEREAYNEYADKFYELGIKLVKGELA